MAFKNIFSSIYAIVENVNYNGSRKYLTFDLVLYRDSSKEFETGRMQYQVDGNMTSFEIESVITSIPEGITHEAMPDDFDFDVFDTFKPYLIGNNPTSDEFTEAGCGELKTGFQYICELPPTPNDNGEWPSRLTQEYEVIPNPDYDPDIPEGTEGSADWNFPTMMGDEQIRIWHNIKYEWGALHRDTSYAFHDSAGNYWTVSGDTGSINVQQIDKPFLDDDWETWFSSSSMDALNKNISERIYSWLKTKPEYADAVSI
jgi:hypothetical protein